MDENPTYTPEQFDKLVDKAKKAYKRRYKEHQRLVRQPCQCDRITCYRCIKVANSRRALDDAVTYLPR